MTRKAMQDETMEYSKSFKDFRVHEKEVYSYMYFKVQY